MPLCQRNVGEHGLEALGGGTIGDDRECDPLLSADGPHPAVDLNGCGAGGGAWRQQLSDGRGQGRGEGRQRTTEEHSDQVKAQLPESIHSGSLARSATDQVTTTFN